jgi:hypothetical protein
MACIMPIREYHRAIVLSGIGHRAGGSLNLRHCVF